MVDRTREDCTISASISTPTSLLAEGDLEFTTAKTPERARESRRCFQCGVSRALLLHGSQFPVLIGGSGKTKKCPLKWKRLHEKHGTEEYTVKKSAYVSSEVCVAVLENPTAQSQPRTMTILRRYVRWPFGFSRQRVNVTDKKPFGGVRKEVSPRRPTLRPLAEV